MKRRICIVGLLLALIPAFIPAVARAQEPCAGYMSAGGLHHIPAPWLEGALRSGGFSAYRFGGSSLILAFQVSACGGRWMFATFRFGNFTTNFFPDNGWGYIAQQVKRFHAAPVRASFVGATLRGLAAGMSMPANLQLMLMPSMAAICRGVPGAANWLPECNRA